MLYTRWMLLASTASSRGFSGWMRRAIAPVLQVLTRATRAAYPSRQRPHPRIAEASSPWRMNALGWPLSAIAAAALAATAGGCGPSGAYLSADRATYDAIAPEYAAYVATDATLDAAARQRRSRTLEAWKLRIDSAAPTTQPAVQ